MTRKLIRQVILEGIARDDGGRMGVDVDYSPRSWLGRRLTASESVQFSRELRRMEGERIVHCVGGCSGYRATMIRRIDPTWLTPDGPTPANSTNSTTPAPEAGTAAPAGQQDTPTAAAEPQKSATV